MYMCVHAHVCVLFVRERDMFTPNAQIKMYGYREILHTHTHTHTHTHAHAGWSKNVAESATHLEDNSPELLGG